MKTLWLLAALTGLTAATAASADEPGMWQAHELQFQYLAFSVAYSCQGLETELRGLLEQSGAQQISVTPAGPCNGAGRTIMARLKFSTLRPTALRETDDRRSVRGDWHHVTIAPRDLLRQGGDCELVQQFQTRILPLFDTREVAANLSCVPFQSSGYRFSLTFDVFAPDDARLTVSSDVP